VKSDSHSCEKATLTAMLFFVEIVRDKTTDNSDISRWDLPVSAPETQTTKTT